MINWELTLLYFLLARYWRLYQSYLYIFLLYFFNHAQISEEFGGQDGDDLAFWVLLLTWDHLGLSDVIVVWRFVHCEVRDKNLSSGRGETEPVDLSGEIDSFEGVYKVTFALIAK